MRSKILVALAIAAVAVAGAALAAIPDGNGVIHACRKVDGGALRVVAKASACRSRRAGARLEPAWSGGSDRPGGPRSGPRVRPAPRGRRVRRAPGSPRSTPLRGSAARIAGQAGAISIAYDGSGLAQIQLRRGRGRRRGHPDQRVLGGDRGRARRRVRRDRQHRDGGGRPLRLEARLPVRSGDERRLARHARRRHDAGCRERSSSSEARATRARIRPTSRSRPASPRLRAESRSRTPTETSSTPWAGATRRTRSSKEPRRLRLRSRPLPGRATRAIRTAMTRT